MIRVQKPDRPPFMLTAAASPDSRGAKNRGPALTAALIAEADAGETDFSFRSETYGAKSVKKALIAAQNRKCCFCESEVTAVAHGDVEHFRPKGGWDQEDGAGLQKPGYYWLAYDWTNLYLACQICNQSFKRNLSPLADPSARARRHTDNVTAERPLLIDPGAEDPEAVIGWRGEVPVPRGGDARGAATIRITGLDRPILNDARLRHLDDLRLFRDLADLLADIPTAERTPEEEDQLGRLRNRLADAVRDDAVYAAMARAELGGG